MFADEKNAHSLSIKPIQAASLGWNTLHQKAKNFIDDSPPTSKFPFLQCKIDTRGSLNAVNPHAAMVRAPPEHLHSSFNSAQNLSFEIAQIHLRFADLLRSTSHPEVSLLHDQFIRASASVEVGRQCRLKSVSREDRHLVHSLYDHSHQTLINTTKMQIDDMENQIIQPIDLSKKRHNRKQPHPMPIPRSNKSESDETCQLKEDFPTSSPTRPICKPQHSPLIQPSPSKGSARPMNIDASRILNEWYLKHHDHPYPSHEVSLKLAKAGNVTTGQVKKWFANRRRRDGNIKPLSTVTARRRQTQIGEEMDGNNVEPPIQCEEMSDIEPPIPLRMKSI